MSGRRVFLTGTISTLLGLIRELIFLSFLFSAFNLLPVRFWLQEVNRNCGAYYFLVHFLSLVVLTLFRQGLSKKWKTFTLLHAFMFCWYGAHFIPFYFAPVQSIAATEQISPERLADFKLYYANIESANQSFDLVKQQISTNKPEIVCLVEMTDQWDKELSLDSEYPYTYKNLRNDNFGLAIYSKLPFRKEDVQDFGPDLVPAIWVEIPIAEHKSLRIVLLHAIPPISSEAYYHNKILFRRIASKIRFLDEPLLVVGDFNATPFSPFYKNLLNWTSLSNVMWGQGLLRTWNAKNPIFRFTLDHVLYNSYLKVKHAELLAFIGSDHFPYLVDFSLLSEPAKTDPT